jgi:phage-related protein
VAIVGTAFVRLRVIGDKLKGDIADATKKAVNDAAPDLKRSGEGAGEHVSEGMTDTVEHDTRSAMDRIGDDIGNALGNAMGNALGKSLRRRVGDAISNGLASGRTELNRAQDFFKPVSDKFEQFFGEKSKHFEGIFKNALVSGIGLAVVAAPSALAFLGAAVGAVAATAVTAIAAMGPVFAGAGLAGVAAMSSIKLAVGLVGLALKTQTPQLEAFQKNLQAVKDTVGTQVQAGMMNGLNSGVKEIQRSLPAVRGELNLFGSAIGDVAGNMALAFTTPQNLYRFNQVLHQTSVLVDGVGFGAGYFGQALLILLSHLGPIIDYLASGASDLGNWALNTITAAEASGALDSWISRMFNSMTFFVGILVDFGKGIINVFRAAFESSGGMVTHLADIARNFREWTGDPGNQAKMVDFFDRMRTITGELLGVFGKMAGAAGRALNRTDVDRFTGALNTLVGLGRPLAQAFNQIRDAAGDKLQQALQNFVDMVTQLANSGVIGVVASALSNLFWVISQLLQIPGIGPLLAFGAGLLTIFKTVSLLWTVLGPVVEILWTLIEVVGGALVAAFGWIPVVIGLVIAALVWFFTQTEIGRHIVEVVWNAIKAAIGAAIDGIVAAFNWVMGVLGDLWDWVKTAAQGIWDALVGAFNSVVGAVSTAWNAVVGAVTTALSAVWGAITSVWNAVWGFLQPILQAIWGFIQTVFNTIVSIVQVALDILYQIWIRVWPLLALPIRILYGVVILIFQGIVDFITWAFNLVASVVTTVWNAIWGFLQPIIQGIWDFIVAAWTAIYTAISDALNWIWGIIVSVWSTISGWIVGAVTAIYNFYVGIWNAITGAISAALNAVWGVITSVWNAIWGFIQPILSAIGNTISGIWNGIVGAVSTAVHKVQGVIQDVWNAITGFLRGAMDTISGLISGAWNIVGDAGSAALSGIKSAVNAVIGAINTVISGINWAIDMANKLPGPDIPNIPSIPKLARGGVVPATTDGTLALIGEAGRSERVEPLDPSGLSARDRALIDRLASGGGAPSITVYLGTREIEDIVGVVVADHDGRLADRISTGTKG